MYSIRKIILSVFIIGAAISTTRSLSAAPLIAQEDTESPDGNSTSTDDFDAMAQDMEDMGVAADEPKPLSTVDRWVQQICSPVIMKYVLLKGYMRDWCYWMVGVKKVSDKK